jgi:aspartate-semialdehyde dehydrogenase
VLGSPRSAGQEVEVLGDVQKVAPLAEAAFRGCDAAILCAPAELARTWAPRAWAQGCPAVDVSAAFREDPEIPLVVPEVNPAALEGLRSRGIVACPGPLATALALLAAPLREAGLARVVVTALVPASGEGRAGVAELERQARDLLALREPEPAARFPHRLAFNAVPQAGAFGEGGDSEAEAGAARELRRVLGLPGLPVSATVVRVPVFYGDLVMVHLDLERPLDAGAARDRLRAAAGLKVIDDPAQGVYPMPMLASQEDAVLVGRVRAPRQGSLDLVAVLEAARRGAATTALGIVERLTRR